jgi:hypothetical protein
MIVLMKVVKKFFQANAFLRPVIQDKSQFWSATQPQAMSHSVAHVARSRNQPLKGLLLSGCVAQYAHQYPRMLKVGAQFHARHSRKTNARVAQILRDHNRHFSPDLVCEALDAM